MSVQHTPGPWRVKDGHYPAFIEIEGPSFPISIVLSATNLSLNSSFQRSVDADFIAAAPETAAERDQLKEINRELLEALKSLLAAHDCGADETGYVADVGFMDIDAIAEQARAAIAKAEGGQS